MSQLEKIELTPEVTRRYELAYFQTRGQKIAGEVESIRKRFDSGQIPEETQAVYREIGGPTSFQLDLSNRKGRNIPRIGTVIESSRLFLVCSDMPRVVSREIY